MERLTLAKIEAVKCLTLHRIASSLHRFCCPALFLRKCLIKFIVGFPNVRVADLCVATTCTPTSNRNTRITLLPEVCATGWTEVGKRNFFLSPQSQFRNLKEALPQSQFRNFLKKCCSTTATPQFRNPNFFWSPQLESFNSASGQCMEKKLEVKNLMLLSL